MKVVYISIEDLTPRIQRDWYIKDLIELNHEVVFWVYGNYFEHKINKSLIPVLRLDSKKKLIHELRKTIPCETRYIILIPYDGRFVELFRALKIYKCETYFFSWGAIPSQKLSESILNKILQKKINIKTFFNLYYLIKLKISHSTGYSVGFNKIFTSGDLIKQQFINSNCKIIETHLPDYDNYLNSNIFNSSKKYAIFLDVNLPFHDDLKFNGLKQINQNNYFNTLNNYFDHLEKKYSIKIIIALHPTVLVENYKCLNREMYIGNTPELVKGAEFVISHHSTSISYAIFGYKPVILIYTNEYKQMYEKTFFLQLKMQFLLLACDLVNIDKVYKHAPNLNVNYKLYDSYKYNYIVSKKNQQFLARNIFLNNITQF